MPGTAAPLLFAFDGIHSPAPHGPWLHQRHDVSVALLCPLSPGAPCVLLFHVIHRVLA